MAREPLSWNVKEDIIKTYKGVHITVDKDDSQKNFEDKWESYSADVYLSYFWVRAPSDIVDWVVRRYTAFFTGKSTMIGIGFGILLSKLIVWFLSLGWTTTDTVISSIAIGLTLLIWRNAEYARSEARQMIDLWLANAFNPHLAPIMNQIQQSTGIVPLSTGTTKKQE